MLPECPKADGVSAVDGANPPKPHGENRLRGDL
jgi:hypothetical protein